MNDKSKNLYLVGFMGVGKSVIGRRLAGELGLRFVDTDHAIEKAQGLAGGSTGRRSGVNAR